MMATRRNKKIGGKKKNQPPIDIDKILTAYEKKGGNLSATATALGTSRQSLYTWRKEYPALEERMKDIDESLIDFSESKLMEAIQDGNLTAIIFHLKTKGKSRGYIERMENNISITPFEDLMMSIPDDEE